ncbi:PREDICTED: uncharacterized protein LOC107092532 [Cyprinodon variegatus]|uniref:uncharacterized protein LOC107092532 n=1 Tax=Cyprinodon variegatus TaxID=28743 RepID=UPI0007425A6B|nr:PREDICTED: uncharacterized protein LOC107092532 [Cyprinodon variegatus]
MKPLVWLPLLLVHLVDTGSTQKSDSCFSPSTKEIWKTAGQKAVLSCCVKPKKSPESLKFEWFFVKEGSHQLLIRNAKYNRNGGSLEINSLNVSDTGIYLCAATKEGTGDCDLPFVCEGTTLIVEASVTAMVKKFLLWFSFTLLAIYCVSIVTLIVVRKQGFNLKFCKRTSKTETNSLKKKTQFRDVVQELHSRVNLSKRKPSTRGNNSQVEAASEDGIITTDDIYQNV